MPSFVFFAGSGSGEKVEPLGVLVNEEPREVFDKYASAQGLPFPLTFFRGGEVYVNPATIAYWLAQT